MKKNFLNENHIRQLVKETLENLILGEDDMNDMNSIEFIKNSTITDIEFIDINGNNGTIGLVLNNESLDSIGLEIYFTVYGHLTDYDSGDYYTPPSGGEFEMTDIYAYGASLFIEGDEKEINIRENREFFNALLKKYWYDIYEEVEPEYFENEGPDPDEKYDAWKNGDYND